MRKFLSLVVAVGLIVAISADSVDVSAQADPPIQFDGIYYPWVPHGDVIDGTGPWYGSITVQNVDVEGDNLGVRIWVLDARTMNQIAMNDDGTGDDYSFEDALEDSRVPRYDLDPNASITLSSAELGIEEPGSALAVYAVYKQAWDLRLDHPTEAFDIGAPTVAGIQKQALGTPMTNARTTDAHLSVDGYTAIPFADVPWGSQSEFCYEIAGGVDSCDGTGFHTLPGGAASGFDGHSYLPIVQTNSGWNTVLHVSNIDPSAWSGQVNVRLIATEQVASPASRSDSIALERTLRPGETWTIDLKGEGIPEGWIGSAHITSNIGVVASSLRFKPETGMLMTNVSAPSLLATTSLGTEDQGEYQAAGNDVAPYQSVGSSGFEMYAPLVFLNFNGWNTGISILNIAEMTNAVTATFYGPDGNVYWADLVTIAPRGQRFIHLPAPEESGVDTGWVGSLVLSAPFEFHAAIDQIKYSTGEAMSYMATAAGARAQSSGDPWPNADTLSLPLVQKGHLDGSGDTSGIQLFNASMNGPVDVEIEFRSQVGNVIPPTQTVPLRMTIPPMGSQTIHAMDLGEMAPNTAGTATVRITGGEGQLVGVSNLVNYAVESDGSAAFNLVNTFGQYRFPVSQTTSLTPP